MQGLLDRPYMVARANSGIAFRPDSSCVLWLPGQDDAYSSTIRDRSGKGNNGTLTGATWARNSQGLWIQRFDGTDDYITCGTPTVTAYPFTVACWVNEATENDGFLIGMFDKSEPDVWYGIHIEGNVARVAAKNTTYASGNGSTTFGGTGCHQVIGVYRSNTDKELYVDGASEATLTANVTFSAGTDLVAIGMFRDSSPSADIAGDIVLERIFNRSLSVTEISNLYQQERHLFGV